LAWSTTAVPNVSWINGELIAVAAVAPGDLLRLQVTAAKATGLRALHHLPPDTGVFAATVRAALEARCARLTPAFDGYTFAVVPLGDGFKVTFIKN
jgi:hypothetical protein